MEADFWHALWDEGKTGWHMGDTNKLLKNNYHHLQLSKNSRVFVPLCGKTLDIKWLLEIGLRVVGIELNENAVKDLFVTLQLHPTVCSMGKFKLYRSEHLEVFVGDIFDLKQDVLGLIDAVYDRGATVALPFEMRKSYTQLLVALTQSAPQLLICYHYDQKLKNGPPFSITTEMLHEYYREVYSIELLESLDLSNSDMKMIENVWLLTKI